MKTIASIGLALLIATTPTLASANETVTVPARDVTVTEALNPWRLQLLVKGKDFVTEKGRNHRRALVQYEHYDNTTFLAFRLKRFIAAHLNESLVLGKKRKLVGRDESGRPRVNIVLASLEFATPPTFPISMDLDVSAYCGRPDNTGEKGPPTYFLASSPQVSLQVDYNDPYATENCLKLTTAQGIPLIGDPPVRRRVTFTSIEDFAESRKMKIEAIPEEGGKTE